jgi:hypothetical protein
MHTNFLKSTTPYFVQAADRQRWDLTNRKRKDKEEPEKTLKLGERMVLA